MVDGAASAHRTVSFGSRGTAFAASAQKLVEIGLGESERHVHTGRAFGATGSCRNRLSMNPYSLRLRAVASSWPSGALLLEPLEYETAKYQPRLARVELELVGNGLEGPTEAVHGRALP